MCFRNAFALSMLCLIPILFQTTQAQTTSFTYQGSLQIGGSPANGNYDFEFALFSAASGGSQLGTTHAVNGVTVDKGIFTVTLNFGDQFPGADRFLEIRVRPSGGSAFTTLTPRQLFSSSPYSVKSLSADNAVNASNATNAAQLAGIAASQFVLTGDIRLSDARNPLPNSANYIQNQNVGPQASSNFNISGSGTIGGTLQAGIVRASQFNLGTDRVLHANICSQNTFVGIGAGEVNVGCAFNGNKNSFFGFSAGKANTGSPSDQHNSFFGANAGDVNTSGLQNSFFGSDSGGATTTGDDNSFFGKGAGLSNTTGNKNTLIGSSSDVASTGLSNATAIGANAWVSQSNSLVLGSINGINGALANARIGVGTPAPEKEFHVRGPGDVEAMIESSDDPGGRKWSLQSSSGASGGRFEIIDRTAVANRFTILSDGKVGIGSTLPTERLHVNGNSLVTGSASANVVNAGTQFNLAGSRILSVSTVESTFAGLFAGATTDPASVGNTFFGFAAGQNNVSGGSNSYFGTQAGKLSTGSGNSFFGYRAGTSNTSANGNSFFGSEAGAATITGAENSFFGAGSGANTTIGNDNAFFGYQTGNSNTTGNDNSFFGRGSGFRNTSGSRNTFFGRSAGFFNETGNENTFFGHQAGLSNTTSNNSFFGFQAGRETTGINNSFFGWSSGRNTTTGTNNSFFGVQSGLNNQTGIGNVFIGRDAGRENIAGNENTFIGFNAGLLATGDNNTALGAGASVASGVNFATAIGAGASVSTIATVVIGRSSDRVIIPGHLELDQIDAAPGWTRVAFGNRVVFNGPVTFNDDIETSMTVNGTITSILASGGLNPLCFNTIKDSELRTIARCASSRIYKNNISPFSQGLSLINHLRPVSFNWKSNGMADLGLVAEEVADVEPLLATYNDQGEVEGVKYDRIGVILINAVKEQQAQIEALQKRAEDSERTIRSLKNEIRTLKRSAARNRK